MKATGTIVSIKLRYSEALSAGVSCLLFLIKVVAVLLSVDFQAGYIDPQLEVFFYVRVCVCVYTCTK